MEKSYPRTAVAQITTYPGEFRKNQVKIVAALRAAREQQAGLVVFPELTIPGYAHLDLALRTEYVDANLRCLEELLPETADLTALIGFIDRDPAERGPNNQPVLYNSVAVIHNGELVAIRDKTLLPSYDIFYEERYYTPGTRRGIVEVAGLKLGIGVCEDLWSEGYSTKIYPQLIQAGADLLVNLSASPLHLAKLQERVQRIAEISKNHHLPFVYTNLSGSFDGYEGEIVFDGRSLVFDQAGQLVGLGATFAEDLFVVDFERAQPLLLSAYDEAEEIYGALVLGIREYFRRNGFQRAYLGLSGGIDSAIVAALAVEALGAANVIGVTMPSHITTDATRNDALLLAKNLGIRCDLRPILPEYQSWQNEFKESIGKEPLSLTKQNKQARIRGAILMEYSNEDPRGLVITTGNKTELATGYCTLYGDMCGGLAAISDVSKERVYLLSQLVNRRAGCDIIPESIIKRVPTAELEVGQTDAANLPADYEVLSPLVTDIVDNEISFQDLCRRYDKTVVQETLRLIHRSEFKRRQAPPGIRVTRKAFGIGRRYPLTHSFFE